MSMMITNADGTEVEVFTQDDVKAQITAKESAFASEKSALEAKIAETTAALAERAGEFKQFRKLNDEAVAKLSAAERVNYENSVVLNNALEEKKALEAKIAASNVDNTIIRVAGTDEKLIAKVKEMWGLVNLEANTPEQIETKTKMILGMINVAQPDLLAGVSNFSGGSFQPPVTTPKVQGDVKVDPARALQGAKELGLDPKALGLTQ